MVDTVNTTSQPSQIHLMHLILFYSQVGMIIKEG